MQKHLIPILAITSLLLSIFVIIRFVAHPASVGPFIRVFQTTRALENKYTETREKIIELEEKCESWNPGPPPPWYKLGRLNPKWSASNSAYQMYKTELEAAEGLQNSLKEKLDGNSWHKIKGFVSDLWSNLVRPVLELLLALTLLSFGLRVTLRYLIMHGKIGTVRV